jgi:small-conductance mechanosensitive channel
MLFRIQYFIDVNKNHILKVRSEVNFAAWDALKRAGIRIPYAQQDLYIKEWPENAEMDQRRTKIMTSPEGEPHTPRSPSAPLIGI